MARPRVDVGVVTWNTAQLTADALRNLIDSDQGVDIRLLVRDNGSEDGTPEVVAQKVPEAEIEVGPNVGFGAGTNALIAKSDAPWFFALNPDAWPEPGAIGRLVEVATAAPRAAAVAPRIENPNGGLEYSTHPFPSARVAAVVGFGLDRVLPRTILERMALERYWLHDAPRTVDWAVGAALLMRRTALDEIGGFDEKFFMYAEDLEWCWRAHRRGWEIRFEPTALVRHHRNVSGRKAFGGGRPVGRYYHNTYRFYRDEHGRAATWLLRNLNLVGALRLAALARLRGDDAARRQWMEQARAHRFPDRVADEPASASGLPPRDRAV